MMTSAPILLSFSLLLLFVGSSVGQFDNSQPLDVNNFGVDNPIFGAAIRSINIAVNAIKANGDKVADLFKGRLSGMGDKLRDAFANLSTLLSPPPNSPETLADTVGKLKAAFQDINDIFNEINAMGIPLDSIPFPPLLLVRNVVRMGIPACTAVETGLRVSGAVGGEFKGVGVTSPV